MWLKRTTRRDPAFLSGTAYRPWLETLETRLPVSDALLGTLLVSPLALTGLAIPNQVPQQAEMADPPASSVLANGGDTAALTVEEDLGPSFAATLVSSTSPPASHSPLPPIQTAEGSPAGDLTSPFDEGEGAAAGMQGLPLASVSAVNPTPPVLADGTIAPSRSDSLAPPVGQTPAGLSRLNLDRPTGPASRPGAAQRDPGQNDIGPLVVQPGESAYLYGIHDLPDNTGTLDNLLNHKGWVLLLKYISAGPAPHDPLIDQLVGAGYGVVVRLHWDTGDGQGTIPVPALYPTFAANAKGTVQNNPAAKYWIIANEPNLCTEWPVGNGYVCNGRATTPITMTDYANAYLQTYDKIHELDGTISYLHVIPAPLATWAGDLPGASDFLCGWDQLMQDIPHAKIDALAFHPKTHTYSAAAITALTLSQPVFGCGHNEAVHWEFPVYRDQMQRVPADLRDRKVFFTELNPEPGWTNTDLGYNVAAYNEINNWNHGQVAGWTGQKVTGMMVYRWLGGETQWNVKDKPNVQNDLHNAATHGYTWDFSSWSSWASTGNGGTTDDAPALATFNSQLVALVRGDDRQAYFSTSTNGSTWAAWQTVTSQLTDTAPALATFAGRLFAFAVGSDGNLYTSYSVDGINWWPWSQATPQYLGISQPVAAAEYGGLLYVFARGNDQHIYFTATADGMSWTRWHETPPYNGLTNNAPSVTVFGGKLYVVVVGVGGNLFYDAFDGTNWSGWTLVYDGVQADQGVATAVYNGKLFLMRKNASATTLAYAWTADGKTWNAWQDPDNGGTTAVSPALAVFGGKLYAMRQDSVNRALYVSSYAE
jgi:hypothetical protein